MKAWSVMAVWLAIAGPCAWAARDSAQPEPLPCAVLQGLVERGPSQRAGDEAFALLRETRQAASIRREACGALANLRHTEALPELVALLSSDDPALAAAAGVALRSITGLPYPADAPRWQTWWATEQAQAPQLLAQLCLQINAGGDAAPSRIEQLVDVISLRHQVVGFLLPRLHARDFRIRAASCNVLAQCADERALHPLTELLADPQPEVSFGAWRALQHLTGQRLPRAYLAWQAYLWDRETRRIFSAVSP
jgi:hypothetical protein